MRMAVTTSEHCLNTRKDFEIVDITATVQEAVKQSHIRNGLVTMFTPHTTCAIRINEAEENLLRDIEVFLDKIAPGRGDYAHNESPIDKRVNAHSHLRSLLLNTSETIPIHEGNLCLGRWQRVFFIELDGPRRERRFYIEVLG